VRFKNVSSVGALDIPLLGRVIAAGEEFDVPLDAGRLLEEQPANFERIITPKGANK